MVKRIELLLNQVQNGTLSTEKALDLLKDLPFKDLGHTKIDSHRALRNGFPEVIYGAGKTSEQVIDILDHLSFDESVLITRADAQMASAVCEKFGQIEHDKISGTLIYKHPDHCYVDGEILILTAGTSDLAIAQEAYLTADLLGNRTKIISDIGVAGIHRLFDRLDEIRQAKVLIVIAGMEGALASVVGGLVDQPIIAVPTSVGYGANFDGLSALLGMLTSCSSGVTVVNIDNGFGAACAASKINHL